MVIAVLLAVVATTEVLALSASASTTATAKATRVMTLRPVRVNGSVATGWRATSYHFPKWFINNSCGTSWISSKSHGIDSCGAKADFPMPCWRPGRHTLLCLTVDVISSHRGRLSTRLLRTSYSGKFNSNAVTKDPVPQTLVLGNGQTCEILTGEGPWGSAPGHPHWFGTYYCSDGAIYSPSRYGKTEGINESHRLWTVTWFSDGKRDRDGHVETVTRAYYVGTAR